jgi:hypothetical protein
MIVPLYIEDLKGILAEFKPEIIYPYDPRYLPFYEELKTKIINGIWHPQGNQYRYVPGRIGWYGSLCRFQKWHKPTKTRVPGTPDIRDIEWHFAYFVMEAEGFSGFSEDIRVTCDEAVLWEDKEFLEDYRLAAMKKPNGMYKEYVPARTYLFDRHDQPLGHPLYYNEAKNMMIFGTRGGGKSFFTALAVSLYDIVTSGIKYYKPYLETTSRAELQLCAGQESKFNEHADKIQYAMDQFYNNSELGVWGKPGDDDFTPSFFYRTMTGKLASNQMWEHSYSREVDGIVEENVGTGSFIHSIIYSMNDPASAQKAAGGRRTKVVYEEAGLIKNILDAWGSNNGMVKGDMEQMGTQIFIGTSGNMKMVRGVKRIFDNPGEFNVIPFRYGDKEQGFFLPSWATDGRYKDENGNTDIPKAKEAHEKIYKEKSLNKDPKIFQHYRMNYPLEIPDMWVTEEGSYLPVKEAQERERQLLQNRLYEDIGIHVDLYHHPDKTNGVAYDIRHNALPYHAWPLEDDREEYEPVVTIYDQPFTINGVIPDDAYLITYDPYVTDEMYKGGSLGVAHVWCNPKYIPFGAKGNCLAATLIGRPLEGLKRFNEILELLIQYYGNPTHGLWYEANRGADVRSHFLYKEKLNLLCLSPQFSQGQYIYEKAANRTGFTVGGKEAKIHLLDRFAAWLKTETTLPDIDGNPETLLNIYRIPCIFTIRQIAAFNLEENFDAVSSAIALPLAMGEREHLDKLKRTQNAGAFSGIKKNLKSRYG